jgi:glutathione S-transferase
LRKSAFPYSPTSGEKQIGLYSPARRVPVLVDGDLSVWDTQSIYSYLRELYPTAIGWPKDREARALARSIAAEMHAGFMGVRNDLPQNIRARRTLPLESLSSATLQEIERILFIWGDCKKRYGDGGLWLFGEFTIADVVYAPVALRFLTYDIPVTPAAKFFMDEVESLPSIQQWAADSAAETETLDFIDDLST